MNIFNEVSTNQGGWMDRFGATWKKQVALLQERFGSSIQEVRWPREYPTDVPILFVEKGALLSVLEMLKQDAEMQYNLLMDLTATDEESDPRFEVVYQLFSLTQKTRIRVKCRIAENEAAPTATGIWPAANWLEREVFDMFGIRFDGHPDLRRILMDERWEGHPLRKDYPLRGYQIFTEPMQARPDLLQD